MTQNNSNNSNNNKNNSISEDSANFARVISIISILIIIVATYFYLSAPPIDKKKYTENEDQQKVEIGGEFELLNLNGEKENTSIYKGRPRLVYFGFTYCPDICPNAMNLISNVLDDAKKYNIDIVPMFITVDPKRDRAENLQKYLGHFHKDIKGYTGSDEEIKKVSDLFKAYYAKVDREDASEDDYLVDHSSFIYILDGDANYMKHFSSTSDPKEITEYLRINFRNVKR